MFRGYRGPATPRIPKSQSYLARAKGYALLCASESSDFLPSSLHAWTDDAPTFRMARRMIKTRIPLAFTRVISLCYSGGIISCTFQDTRESRAGRSEWAFAIRKAYLRRLATFSTLGQITASYVTRRILHANNNNSGSNDRMSQGIFSFHRFYDFSSAGNSDGTSRSPRDRLARQDFVNPPKRDKPRATAVTRRVR